MSQDVSSTENHEESTEQRDYVKGLVLAFILTMASFSVVWFKLLTGPAALVLLGVLALVQCAAQIRYFLHVDGRSHRDDLLLILFTSLIILIIVGGTIWILWNQHARMM
ncbi:MAG TPA: cytochrome o ubiquinol oxidase subunit IV [Pusillimonas sp.]|jgi:cytochrome o ubiquinol oxidase operon protein cyoD|nr:cytochrome o ubiquinol oxidase subunit IV [Pusillimonas sp.]HCN70264.1 cytochrome o ubiquinol oxidase subunit IV [Pusillimonas sp.]|tara:strand:- start:30701 stop:31027 length:327 start_codon:yes stop_codon:yes gene_type:complete